MRNNPLSDSLRSGTLLLGAMLLGAMLLGAMLASAGCMVAVDPAATANSYVRLLNTDIPASLSCMRATGDGNLLFFYTADASGGPALRMELTKVDPNGNVLWTRSYDSIGNYQAGDCLVLSDGTIALVGDHMLDAKNNALDFLHLNADGNPIASTEQLALGLLEAQAIQTDDSGGFVVLCQAKDPLTGGNPLELVVVRLSNTGKMINNTVLSPGGSGTYAFNIQQMSAVKSGTALAAGYSRSIGLPSPAIFPLYESDSIGAPRTFAGAGQLHSLVRTGTSACVIAGDSSAYGSSNGHAWLAAVIVNPSATAASLVWSRTFSLGVASSMVSMIHAANGNFIATGYDVSGDGDTSIHVFRFDSNGNEIWPYKTYGFSGGDVPNSIIELANGDLILGGVTTSFGSRSSGSRQIFLIHLKSDGTPAS